MLFTTPAYSGKGERNFAKDPAVVELGGKYYLYFSIMETESILGIGIAESEDGDNFKVTAIFPRTQDCEKNGIGRRIFYFFQVCFGCG